MAKFKLSIIIILILSSPPTVGFCLDKKAVAIQGLKSELSLLILIFATENVLRMSSDKHVYQWQTYFSDRVIHSNLTEMRNIHHQCKLKIHD